MSQFRANYLEYELKIKLSLNKQNFSKSYLYFFKQVKNSFLVK